MKRIRAALLSTFLLLSAAAFPATAAEEPILNVYNWADYIGPDTIADFTSEFGIKVNYDIYDTSEIVDAKLLAGGTGYDVVVHAGSYSGRLVDTGGIYQPLDRGRLPNWKHLDEDVLRLLREFDPCNRHAVPYMWGTTGIAFNVDMLRTRLPNADLESAEFFFKPELVSRFADCGVTLLDSAIDVVPMAMSYLGHPLNSVDPEHLGEAERLLLAIRPYVRYFSSAKMLIDLPNREVCAAMSWSGDYAVARRRAEEAGIDINLGYAMLEGEIPAWIDGIFIPADAPHPDNAHLFINYLMRPEVVAPITDFTGYANGNAGATPLVDPAITSDPAIYPDADVRGRLRLQLVLPTKQERPRSRTWTRVKSGL